MGWFDSMLTVVSTIGKVAGALSGDKVAALDLGPKGKGAYPQLGQVVFLRRDDGTYAYNQSPDEYAGLFFPGNATLSAASTQLFVPPTQVLKVSDAFVHYANKDVDTFNIVPIPEVPQADTDPPVVQIQAQATQPIPASGARVSIGPYLTARLNASDRTILIGVTGTLTLAAIVLLNLGGAGDTFVRIINAVRSNPEGGADDPQHITVDIPAGFELSGGLTSIDISASVSGLTPLIEDFVRENAHLLSTPTSEDRALLDAYAATVS